MTRIPTCKTYPNVSASGNAILHLGDVIYVSGEGEQRERIALNQIIERLDRIVNSKGSIYHDDYFQSYDPHETDRESSQSSADVEASALTPMSNSLHRSHLYHSHINSNLPHLSETSHPARASDRYERYSMTYSSIGLKKRPSRHTESTVFVNELAIGKLIVRVHSSHEFMGAPDGPTTSRSYRLSAHFISKSWFHQKVIRLGLTWSIFGQEISGISLNPSFADIVPDQHPIILCAATGDVSGLKALLMLENGPKPSCTTSAGWSPLHFAAAGGHYEACQLLLCNGASPNAGGDSNINPLHVSAHFGKLNVFRRLLNAGGDLDCLHDHGTNPLLDLLANKSLNRSEEFHDFIHWLIRGQECYLVDTETTDNKGQSVLHYLVETLHAISDGRVNSIVTQMYAESIRALISSGVDIDAKNVDGQALLHAACQHEQIDIIDLLLKHGCDIDVRDAYGCTALHHAVRREDCEVASILIRHGANVTAIAHSEDQLSRWRCDFEYVTPLSLVAANGSTDMFAIIWDQILRTGDDKNFDETYWTEVLRIAVDCNHYDLVEILTAINTSKDALSNALASTHDLKMIELLVLAGASPDGYLADRFRSKLRPLLWAILVSDLDAVKKLLELGADANCTGPQGRSALHYAAARGKAEIVEVLLSHGADNNARDDKGVSAAEELLSRGFADLAQGLSAESTQIPIHDLSLMRACQTNNIDLAKHLITEGASLDNNMLSFAIVGENFDVAEYLVEAGARVHRAHVWSDGELTEDVPLLNAIQRHSGRLIKAMIARGAGVNEILDKNDTPLLHVLDRFWIGEPSESERTQIARTLLGAGAKINVKDVFGRTPLGKAAQIGALEIARLLIEGGAELDELCTMNISNGPNETDIRCIPPRTPLAWAARNGDVDMVRLLYEAGAHWKSLKKDPAVSHVHGFLMKSWFVDSVRSKMSEQDGSSCVIESTQSGLSRSSGVHTTSQRGREDSVCTQSSSLIHAWYPEGDSDNRPKLLWFMGLILRRSAKLVYATTWHILLEVFVFIAIASLVTTRWVCRQIPRMMVGG